MFMKFNSVMKCTSKPTGRFDSWGEAICKKCTPYWVVRIYNPASGACLIDAYCDTEEQAAVLREKVGTIPANKEVAGKVPAGVVLALIP